MGTKGSFGFIINEDSYLTYNHFDSYPSGGLGEEILDFISKINNWDNLKNKISKIKKVNEGDEPSDELKEKYKKFYQYVDNGKNWYAYLRNLQGVEWIKHIDEIEHMTFLNYSLDSLIEDIYIEYVYIINLDDMTFNFWDTRNTTKPDVKIPLKIVNKITAKDLDNFEESNTIKKILKIEERKEKIKKLKDYE